jgi:hypothetical protein
MKNNYLLSWTTDFFDELVYSWHDRKSLKKLFSLFQSWGMQRVYWIYTFKYAEGKFDCNPYKNISSNAKKTYEHIGEFLPAVVEIAHELGIEFYAIYKPFDLGFHRSFPFNTLEAEKHGKIDCLSGRLYWAINSLVKLQDKRLQRHPADLQDKLEKKIITRIKLTADAEDQPIFGHDELKILVSDDNGAYKEYKGNHTFRHSLEKGERIVYLENLNIQNKYMALKCDIPEYHSCFSNTLKRLVTLYGADGNEIPFTYGTPRLNPKLKGAAGTAMASPFRADVLKGYRFDDGNGCEGGLRASTHSIDNSNLNGITALAKGKDRYIRGALSPAYPEVRECWLNHIRECLDAGVDGIDIRAANHNRSYEWERYGFEPPVINDYKKRYGVDITKEKFSSTKHRKFMGEYYTRFLKQGLELIHSYGKKAQVHIMPNQMGDYPQKRYMNFNWEWKKWLSDAGFDAVTIKDGPWFDESVWEPIAKQINNKRIPAFLCSYWKSVANKPDWQKKFKQSLDDSLANGQAGFILYESAMVTKIVNRGELQLLYPDIPEILKDFHKRHNM